MAEWLEQTSQWNEMYCHDKKIMSSNPAQVKLVVRSTSIQVGLNIVYFQRKWIRQG